MKNFTLLFIITLLPQCVDAMHPTIKHTLVGIENFRKLHPGCIDPDNSCENINGAAYVGCLNCLTDMLQDESCNLEKKTFGLTSLHQAAAKGNPQVLCMLLNAGALVDAVPEFEKSNYAHYTALCWAIRAKNNACIEILIAYGANISDLVYEVAQQFEYTRAIGLILENPDIKAHRKMIVDNQKRLKMASDEKLRKIKEEEALRVMVQEWVMVDKKNTPVFTDKSCTIS